MRAGSALLGGTKPVVLLYAARYRWEDHFPFLKPMPHHLRFITLTGVDDWTNLAELLALSRDYPFVEWGALYDPRKAGMAPRYPSLESIERFAAFAQEHDLHAALHLCGPIVKELIEMSDLDDPEHPVMQLAGRFGRVQLNCNIRGSKLDSGSLLCLMDRLKRSESRTRAIVQYHEGNRQFAELLLQNNQYDVLFDESGGRGVQRTSWPDRVWTSFSRPGFAGGIGPDNIESVFDSLRKLPLKSAFWVDMEQRIRDERDRLDLVLCERVLRAGAQFIQAEEDAAALLWPAGDVAVQDLSPLWLHWWTARALGYDVAVPPPGVNEDDADLVFYLERQSGRWTHLGLNKNHAELTKAFHEHDFRFEPFTQGRWCVSFQGWYSPRAQAAVGPELYEAGMRALVTKAFGPRISRQPRPCLKPRF